jgi:hypothetical protein
MSRRVAALAIVGAALAVTGVVAAAPVVVTSHLATSTNALPAFYPTALALTNGTGTAGKADGGDQVTISFSAVIDHTTMCSSWSNTRTTEHLNNVTVQLGDNSGATGNDTLTVTAVAGNNCRTGGIRVGTVDLGGPGYVTGGTASVTGGSIDLTDGTTSAVTVTLGTKATGGTLQAVTTGAAAVYTPDTAIKDRAAHPIGASVAVSTTTVQL